MEKFTICSFLVILASQLSTVFTQSSTLAGEASKPSVESPSQPDHYYGEKAIVRCTFKLDELPQALPESLSIYTPAEFNVNGDTGLYASCVSSTTPDDTLFWVASNSYTNVDNVALDSTCSGLSTTVSTEYSLQVELTLTTATEYYCLLKLSPALGSLYSEVYQISTIKEAPSGLKLTVDPATELSTGSSFAFYCESAGGNPASNFKYMIGDVEVTSRTHIASAEYHGVEVKCFDLEHEHHNGGGTLLTVQSQTLSVYYLMVANPEQNKTVNPEYEHSLTCDSESNLPENVTLMYKWKQDGTLLENQTELTLQIAPNAEINITETVYTCVVYGGDGELEQEVKFAITWDRDMKPSTTTTPYEPTVLPTKANTEKVASATDSTTVIVIVVLVVAGILIAIIIIVIIRRRRDSGSTELEPSKPDKARDDAESGTQQDGAAEPMLTSDGRETTIEEHGGE